MHAGAHGERATLDHRALAAADRLLVERRNLEVPIDVAQVLQSERFKSDFRNNEARLMHGVSPEFVQLILLTLLRYWGGKGVASPCDS